MFKHISQAPLTVKAVLLFSLLFSFYVAIVSQMIVAQDAQVFFNIAQTIHDKGLTGYFQTGPSREPLYPFLIAGCMHLEKWLPLSYQDILKIIQVFLLFTTQILCFLILSRLGVHTVVSALSLLLLGVLPSMLNAAVSLFSEILSMPFILSGVILMDKSFRFLLKPLQPEGLSAFPKTACLLGALSGLNFILITFNKGAFEFFMPFFLIPYVVLGLHAWKGRQKTAVKNIALFLVSFLIFFYGPLHLMKMGNKIHNGNYVLTDRGSFMLYGNMTRHIEYFSPKNVAIGLICSTQAGQQRICHRLFGQEACAFWDFRMSDHFAHSKGQELRAKNFSEDQVDSEYKKLSLGKILRYPWRVFPFYIAEGLSVIFWKSAEIGFVVYPSWLEKIFKFSVFGYIVSFLTAFGSLAAYLYLGFYVLRKTRPGDYFKQGGHQNFLLLFIFILLSIFIWFHALISVQTRYCLVIAPLYIVIIAFFLDNLISKKIKKAAK